MDDKTKRRRKRKNLLTDSEKKRRCSALLSKTSASRIIIGGEFDRWRSLRDDLQLKSDALTAKYLLDSYFDNKDGKKQSPPNTDPEETIDVPGPSWMTSSTPMHPLHKRLKLIQGSDISAVDSDTRSTAEIEVFNQLILMYCAKRFAYSPPVYRMRNLLAALDHNINIERPLKRNKEGNIIYNRFFNKKSGRWSVHPLKVDKTHDHIKTLAKNALKMRIKDKVGMQRKRTLEPEDPRRISKHLAPVSPPTNTSTR